MKIEMVRCTKKSTGEVVEMSLKHLKQQLKKKPGIVDAYKFEAFAKEIKSFKFIAWIHPLKGGDDYQTEIDQTGETLEIAEKNLKEYLSKVSAITTDYRVA